MRHCYIPADVDGIKVVINYDYPQQTEDYVHRIGRTGRSNATGVAYTFFTMAERKQARELVNILQEAKQDIPSELLRWSQTASGSGGSTRRYGTFRGGNGGYGGQVLSHTKIIVPKMSKSLLSIDRYEEAIHFREK